MTGLETIVWPVLFLLWLLISQVLDIFASRVLTISSSGIQAIATVVLVIITAWYAKQTARTAKTAEKRVNLEIRRNHTDTLRKRVTEWLDNLPAVFSVGIESAPSSDDEFRAFPETLENDPYFADLKENHIEKLNDYIENINNLAREYEESKSAFISNINLTCEIDNRTFIQPAISEWAFERSLLLERTEKDEEEIKENLYEVFTSEPDIRDSNTIYYGDSDERLKKPIFCYYRTQVRSMNRDSIIHHRLSANITKNKIGELPSKNEYQYAEEAADILDELEAEISDLKNKLIEIRDMGYVPDKCKYIDEI